MITAKIRADKSVELNINGTPEEIADEIIAVMQATANIEPIQKIVSRKMDKIINQLEDDLEETHGSVFRN